MLLDSGVPLVHIPCHNVTEHLRATQAEVDRFVRGRGQIGDYLPDHFARSKELWDVGVIARLVNPDWVPMVVVVVVHSPLLTSQGTWSHDPRRHLIREALWADRDAIFADLFAKLQDAA